MPYKFTHRRKTLRVFPTEKPVPAKGISSEQPFRELALFCATHDPEPPILNFKTAVGSVSVCQSRKTLE